MKKRLLYGFLLFIFLLSTFILLSSCQKDTSNSNDTGTGNDTIPQNDSLTVFENGICYFSVTRPETRIKMQPYTDFYNVLKQQSGANSIEFKEDVYYTGSLYDTSRMEIICGHTKHPEVASVIENLPFLDYVITVSGNKILVTGRTEYAIQKALSVFSSYIKQSTENGKLIIPRDLHLTGSAQISTHGILFAYSPTVKSRGRIFISDCGDGFDQATVTESSKETYEEYLHALESSGFTLYTRRNVKGNLYSIYRKNLVTFHVNWTPHSSEMRIISSLGSKPPSLETVSYEKKTEPTFTLMGLEKGGNDGGLGCIAGLEDGSFLIIDGGHNVQSDAEDIYNTLRTLAPDPDHILIRAWIITHGHGDHDGAFAKFSQLYAETGIFTVESFLYNFCDTAEQNQYSVSCYASSTVNTIRRYWSDSTIYKGITGELYRFPGAQVEILYCMSDFLPSVIGAEPNIPDIIKDRVDGNISTMVFRLTLGGQTILITGDTTKTNMDEMCNRYGDYLKSDMMTVAHHGYNHNSYRARNATKEFYDLVDPETVFWPSAADKFAERTNWSGTPGSNCEANYYLIHSLHVKECIVSGSTTRTLTLPYRHL